MGQEASRLNRVVARRGSYHRSILFLWVGIMALMLLSPVVSTGDGASIITMNRTNGATICPEYLGGNGEASWNPNTSTCAVSSTAPVSPTLCVGLRQEGCVLNPISMLVIDSGVTLQLDPRCSLAIYSALDNHGVVEISTNATGINYGTVLNYGTINNSGVVDNLPFNHFGLIINYPSATVINQGTVSNAGTILNNGTIVNKGTIQNTNSSLAIGQVVNLGTIQGNEPYTISPPTPSFNTGIYVIVAVVIIVVLIGILEYRRNK